MTQRSKRQRHLLMPLFLCICLLQVTIYPALANDRSANVIGSLPLQAEGVVAPTGLTGQGQLIGIADSGLDKGSMTDIHLDLQTTSGSIPKVILQSFTDRSIPDDPSGHGTFMAATIAGSGKASGGKYKGIAPGASLYFQALLNKNNNVQVPGDLSQLFLPAYLAGVRIHVNGWGGGTNTYGDHSAAIDKFTYHYRDFLPLFGAGNNGPGGSTLTSEANSKNALVIGSSQLPRPGFDSDARFSDKISVMSSLGPTGDGRIKPDLLAPGSALISACSSLIESNYTANPQYTRMSGTSMSTAVTGGALALLREQLIEQFNLANPTSALLKALLINGARSNQDVNLSKGFGILDLAGTSLALKEGLFEFIENPTRLMQGESRDYRFTVTDTSMPVKVTLTWIDPPAAIGTNPTLLNDLDLIVRDSSGHIYYGNDVNHRGITDRLNNVEQVTIAVPQPGDYTITVKDSQMKSGLTQDFALVYGQSAKTGTIISQSDNQIELTDGTSVSLVNQEVKLLNDGVIASEGTGILPGSSIYQIGEKLYIFGETWQTGGVQSLETDQGSLLLEMNSQVREGGYYIDPQVHSLPGSITVNGLPVSSASFIPSGSEINAAVNPVQQTVWKLEAYNQQVSGYIDKVDIDKRELKLINDDNVYKLASWASVNYHDQVISCSAQDAPYSSSEKSTLDMLLPGSDVTMQVSSRNRMVQSVLVKRRLVIGKVREISYSGEIGLDTGKYYQIFPNSAVYHNDHASSLSDVQTGDLLIAQLLPETSTIIKIQSYSNMVYGRIIYANAAKKVVNVMDAKNQSHIYNIDSETEIFGLGVQVETSSLNSGNWVRIIGDQDNMRARRIDIAEIGEESSKILASIDYTQKLLKMEDGSEYKYGNFTRLSQGGYAIQPEDLIAGETLAITTLAAPSPWQQILTGAEVESPAGAASPVLKISAQSLDGVLILQGWTDTDRLYVYRRNGNRERIDVNNGVVNRIFNLLDKETGISVLALNMKTGAMKDVYLNITVYQDKRVFTGFTDISGSWAESYINDLANRKIVKGYEDGTFRPDQPISRAELMVMLGQLKSLEASQGISNNYFTDQQDIPWWALGYTLAARRDELVVGYPDGSFRPFQAVTRAELNIVYAHLTEAKMENLFPGDTMEPERLVTRAEVAAILDRL